MTGRWTQLATGRLDDALTTLPGLEESPLPEKGLHFRVGLELAEVKSEVLVGVGGLWCYKWGTLLSGHR